MWAEPSKCTGMARPQKPGGKIKARKAASKPQGWQSPAVCKGGVHSCMCTVPAPPHPTTLVLGATHACNDTPRLCASTYKISCHFHL